jgi:Flp pilus assembly pilin Flp
MARQINTILRDTRGIAALEYALIAGLIFAAIIACGHLYASQLQTSLGNIGASILARDAGT